MKVLKTALIILLIGIVIFIGIAILTPPISNTIITTVERPTFFVYSILSTPTTMEQWISGLKSVELISGIANSVGSEYLYNFEIEEYNVPIIVSINDKITNDSINFAIQHKSILSEIDIKLVSRNYYTDLIINYNILPNGILTKIAFPLIKPIIKEYLNESEDNFIELIKGF